MKQSVGVQTFAAPNYYVIYHSNDEDNSRGALKFNYFTELKNTKHFFDNELDSILDVLNYLLHFPRFNFDLSELSPADNNMMSHLAQNIIILPDHLFEELAGGYSIKNSYRSIFIIEDDIYSKISAHEKLIDIKCYSFSELKQIDLKGIWHDLNDYNNGVNDVIQFLEFPNSGVLPLIHFADQIDKVDKEIFGFDAESIIDIANYRWKQQGYLDGMQVLSEMSELEHNILTSDKREYIFNEALMKATFPITITLPGQPMKIDRLTSNNGLPSSERKALWLVGIHNAISTNGIHVPLEVINEECFKELNNLEKSCKEKTNNKYIWRTLRKLGNLLAKHLGPDVVSVIKRASHLNVFSDFPIGLAILPDTDAPLCCHKVITYKPITPLTRALQTEMIMSAPVLLEDNIKVLILECLDEKDDIREASDHIWNVFRESINRKHFNVTYEIIKSTKEFLHAVSKHPDTKILIISSHGHIDVKHNMTAIKIGKDEYWSPVNNEFNSPPIVLFSSCHVCPRGTGAVSIADLFVRSGAHAVLGTLVPVLVDRNGLLMIRLFLYLSQAIDGDHDFKNLAQVWQFVVSSNAVNEIIASTKTLKQWSLNIRKDKSFPLKDFQQKESVGKLRHQSIYSDTLKILRDIAEKDGVLSKLSNALQDDKSFPESLFYQFIGSPETVLINPFNKKF